MAALHEALKALGPADFSDVPLDHLKPFLSEAFSKGQLIVDSVPIPAPSEGSPVPGRSRASSASEIAISSVRSPPPPSDIEALQKEWKSVKLKPAENPLGMSVYKLGAKDGKGAWFARRSVHEGLGFTKWKKGLEREFPETMKVQGGPGEGNIRGIGGERRVEYKNVDGVGKMEVYLLSAQFPGPTTPRDFVTMFLTSDQALSDQSGGVDEVPRHFMVISKPCIHPDTAPREGYIRGSYESVEFIREIPVNKKPQKSASTTNLGSTSRNRSSSIGRKAILRNASNNHSKLSAVDEPTGSEKASESNNDITHNDGRARGKTISFESSRGRDAKGEQVDIPRDDEEESNPIEWIMITRSDPGGSVPRFMVERGTPGGIVSDASKFLDWACAKEVEDFDTDDEAITAKDDEDEKAKAHGHKHHHDHNKDLHNYQTNGHLAGLEEESAETAEQQKPQEEVANSGGVYGIVAGAAGGAGALLASYAPTMITDHLPSSFTTDSTPPNVNGSLRRESVSTISSLSSDITFASALENRDSRTIDEVLSTRSTESTAETRANALKDKELQKLEEKKRRLDEKLSKAREKESSKKSEDTAKEEEAIRKAEEKHQKEVQKQEEKYKREVEKLEKKKEKEAQKAEERKRKAAEKDERTKLLRELEEVKAEVSVLRKEKEILRLQVGELQAENTTLAARIGKLGIKGEEVLREVREEIGKSGRLRASSLKTLPRTSSIRSSGSGEKLGEKPGERDHRIPLPSPT